jgi:serine/threonine-protein kinase
MAPEQLLGLRADERADIFALGVILAESLTGRHPFRHSEADRTIAAILGDPVALGCEDAHVRALEKILQQTLAKDRDRRLASVDELRARVVPALCSCPTLPAPAAPPSVAEERTATLPTRWDDRRPVD